MKVNLGCQIHHFDGWINQDIVEGDPNIRVEWNCDANKLPTGDNTVDFIYAGHLIEHIFPDKLDEYLAEWKRVLKPGGRLIIMTPDIGKVMKGYADGTLQMEHAMQPVFGRYFSWDGEPERHRNLFDDKKIVEVLSKHFSQVERLDLNNPPQELVPFFQRGDISNSQTQLFYGVTK